MAKSPNYRVKPMRTDAIASMADDIWGLVRRLGYNGEKFPISEFLDLHLPKINPDFELEVLDRDEMGDNHGLTFPDLSLIQIRSDVYGNACDGDGCSRFTLAHELGHYVLHKNVGFAFSVEKGVIPVYRQSEWQADTFAAELLMPKWRLKDCKTAYEASQVFGVSITAAIVRMRKRGLISETPFNSTLDKR